MRFQRAAVLRALPSLSHTSFAIEGRSVAEQVLPQVQDEQRWHCDRSKGSSPPWIWVIRDATCGLNIIFEQISSTAGSPPDACRGSPSLEATYRFADNAKAEPKSIFDAHHAATIERICQQGTVILTQDEFLDDFGPCRLNFDALQNVRRRIERCSW